MRYHDASREITILQIEIIFKTKSNATICICVIRENINLF